MDYKRYVALGIPDEIILKFPSFNHFMRRKLIKKYKRNLKRQRNAVLRIKQDEEDAARHLEDPEYLAAQLEEERATEAQTAAEELERQKAEKLWLERELRARIECEKRVLLETKKRMKEQKIREEWERMEKEEKERIHRQLQQPLSEAEAMSPWHNPFTPGTSAAGTSARQEPMEECHLFIKTGACRYGTRCSRSHDIPLLSSTVIFPNMFSSFGLEQTFQRGYDHDVGLEHGDDDLYSEFVDFYEDVLPEFQKFGKVVQFKVAVNYAQHLRGNVYVQYSKETEAMGVIEMFRLRWYNGKQLMPQYRTIDSWKKAICGLYRRNRCQKGRFCNFIHVLPNPGGSFDEADQDWTVNDRRNHLRIQRSNKTTYDSKAISAVVRSLDHDRLSLRAHDERRDDTPKDEKRKRRYNRRSREESPEYHHASSRSLDRGSSHR